MIVHSDAVGSMVFFFVMVASALTLVVVLMCFGGPRISIRRQDLGMVERRLCGVHGVDDRGLAGASSEGGESGAVVLRGQLVYRCAERHEDSGGAECCL